MALPKRDSDGFFEASAPMRRAQIVTLAGDGAIPASSPVHHLQNMLETAFAPEPQVNKWPGAVRMLILGVGIVGPWASIFGIAKLALR